MRASDSSLAVKRAFTPWILGTWRFRTRWAVNASAGVSGQFPDLDAALGSPRSNDLLPERATHIDLGVEHRESGGLLWQATLFNRFEHDVLRGPDLQPRFVEGMPIPLPSPDFYRNSLQGVSRGLELFLARGGPARWSGSISYTYARARQADRRTQETFWSAFDRRHAFNAAGRWHIDPRSSASIVLRGGSGLPIPGYFNLRGGSLVAGERRNEIRLAPYVRLDTRVQRTFFSSRHPMTLFGEILNVLDRRNQGIAEGVIQPVTGEALGFTRPLLPRRASIGIDVAVSR